MRRSVRRAMLARLALLCAAAALAVPSPASETLTYSYDALGRLIKVARTGSVNSGATECYGYDPASNRSNVTVSSGSNCSTSTTLILNPTSLPNGTVGTSYSRTITTSGGTSPYTYQKTSGTLPTGLTLSTGGLLSGTPTTAATSAFTVTATDSASHTGSQAYSLTINTSGTTLTLSPTTLPNGTVGTAYSRTITASGGTSPYTFSKTSGTLPAGLTLSSGGLLSGTPTTAISYSFTVTATDSASHTGSQAYSVTIGSSGGNRPPVAVDDSASVAKCGTKIIAVLTNDSDPDGDPITVIGAAGYGFSLYSSTQVEFDDLDNTGGTYVGSYTIQDSHGATGSANITVTVSSTGQCQ